jgi:transglutaminase-like putative cysteine protease
MRKIITALLVGFLFCTAMSAQPGIYSLNNVPDKVKNNADVVIHHENTDVDIQGVEKFTVKVDKIFTVVNENAKAELIFRQYSSKNISLEDAEIKVFDAGGKQTAKYRKKDMTTIAIGEGLVEDGYVTYYYVPTTVYPVTLEFKYEIRIKGTLSIPDYLIAQENEGIVESDYTVHVLSNLGFRYKAKHTDIQPAIKDEGGVKEFKWGVRNLEPLKDEKGAESQDRYPHITFAVDKFSYYGLEGDLSSWKNFGSWIGNLYNGLDNLPPDRQQFFVDLVKDATDDKEKTARIYHYLQENFRYVSIQLGIGGLKPFPADFTDKKKYGDCKGLSNYMKAALKSVGIKSYVAIINAEYDKEPVDPDFPENGFNHVILCVPEKNDSVWLECTSSSNEFNELGTFTENRYALLITDEGGVLVPTPKSRSSSNTLLATTTISMSDDLSALTETVFTAKGEYRDMMNEILKANRDDQKRIAVLYLGFKQPDDFEFSEEKSPLGSKTKLKMSIAKVPEFSSGDKLFIGTRMYKIWSSVLPKADNRKLDFYFNFPFEKTDTTILKLPAGAKADVLPRENEIDCKYASFRSKYWYDEPSNSIYSACTFVLKQHKIPATDYPSVKKFFDEMMQNDGEKIVVRKGASEKKAF